jgi:chorismate lyase/3-hydroxybenzoate synthase
MNHLPNQLKSLIFQAGATATSVHALDDCVVLASPMPWLAGPETQLSAHGAALDCGAGGWLVQGADTLAGVLVGSGAASIEEEAFQLYRRMFAITSGLNRYRLWNYVPNINAEVAGVENYVAFNAGRHRAFIEQRGGIFTPDLPAASALGTKGGTFALAFAAGTAPVTHYENPLQMPAACYPQRYGNNPPLFARGSKVTAADGSTCWHLSGTSSIRRSDTIGTDFDHQFTITLENIAQILTDMAVPTERHAAWKVFLRDRRDLAVCRQRLAEVFPTEVAQMMFLEADICRRDLLLEIEAVFHQVPATANTITQPGPSHGTDG